jgi:trigger factor
VSIKEIHRRVLPDLNDAFARKIGTCETLEALKEQVMTDLREQAEQDTDRKMRDSLLIQLATRIPGAVPEVLINREIDRRVEHLVTQLVTQRIDPRQANINWEEFRENQRPAATDTVKSTLVLDEIAKQEQIDVVDEELTHEIERLATRSNRTVSATRAILEKEGGAASLAVGIRREKTINLLLEHATVVTA